MTYLPEVIKEIAAMGANIVIEDNHYLPDDLREIVTAVQKAGGTISIETRNLLPETLKELAQIGGNNITFMIQGPKAGEKTLM